MVNYSQTSVYEAPARAQQKEKTGETQPLGEFGKVVRVLRESKDLNQETLARNINMNVSLLKDMEMGTLKFSLVMKWLPEVADGLHVGKRTLFRVLMRLGPFVL